jgi:acetyltransferase-like isoleucine patch superfamily enzyme
MTRGVHQRWARFWMRSGGMGFWGRFATRLASIGAPPHKAARSLAFFNKTGYISPSATIFHSDCILGEHIFLGERVTIFGEKGGGCVKLGDRVTILRDSILETGQGGCIRIGDDAYIHPRCQLNAYITEIRIGAGVMIAANCAFYPHEHGIAPGRTIRSQPLHSRGPIVIGDNAWLGTGVIVLGNVRIGEGAVVGAGAVVTEDIAPDGIAVGVPARVVKSRNDVQANDHNGTSC